MNNHYDLALAYCFSLLGFGVGVPRSHAATVRGQVLLKEAGHTHSKQVNASGVVLCLKSLAQDTLLSKPAPVMVQMIQKNKIFAPHVLPITVGSTIDFPNDDPISHNAFSSYNGQIFEIGRC